MSVAMTNCGDVGWVSDAAGYRYDAHDPLGRRRWPSMPQAFAQLAGEAAQAAGYAGFRPDACLVNLYVPGSRLSLHQDRDERDRSAPIVSVSLGLPAVFLFGGRKRSQRPRRVALQHGDVVVWGGASRLAYHGVAPLAAGTHALLGDCRVNLTFRKAL
jgi:alkylated DNA repair protein (DNA oxidative demethylase)